MDGTKTIGKTIGEVEKLTGIPKRKLKYFMEQNIIRPSQKAENGFWLYSDEDIQRAQLASLRRDLDFPVNAIRTILADPERHWHEELDRHIVRLTNKQGQAEVQLRLAKLLVCREAWDALQIYCGLMKEKDAALAAKQGKWRYDIMKRTLAMLLAALTLFTLSACGKESGGNTPSPAPEETSAPEQTVAPEPEQTAEPSPGDGTSGPFDPSAAMEETVLVDESDVKISATGLKYTANSIKLDLAIENNSGKNLSFLCGTIGYSCNSVNGYMTDEGYLNASVAAGKKINETVSFSSDELSLMGFTDIADIELGFNITDDQYDDYLQTGPRQLKTSIADSYDYSTDTYRESITDSSKAKEFGFTVDYDSEELVYDQKGIRVLSQTLVTNSSGEQALFVEVENTSSDMVYVAVGDVSINGLGIQSGNWSTNWISAGKRRVIPLELSSMLGKAHQEAFGIDKIGSVTYSLVVEDIDFDALVNPQQITFSTPDGGSYDSSGEELYQGDGIRVVSKGLAPDSFDLSDDIHVLLLVENSGSEALNFDVGYDTVSVNGYMTGFICYGKRVEAGGSAVLDVELTGYSLEDNGITGLEDITEAELTLEVKTDNYKTVAEPVVTIAASQ